MICDKYFEMRWLDNWVQRLETYERRYNLSTDALIKIKKKEKQYQDQVRALVVELGLSPPTVDEEPAKAGSKKKPGLEKNPNAKGAISDA